LEWLARPEIAQSERGPRRMRADFERLRAETGGEDFDERFRALRRWKAREMLRIALREVAGWSSVEQTTLELTLVAELCVQVVTRAGSNNSRNDGAARRRSSACSGWENSADRN
jgi:glutamine synthetase adenylyltransferase